MLSTALIFVASVFALGPVPQAPSTLAKRAVWIEAESATQVVGAVVQPSSGRPGVLSGDRWMTFSSEKEKNPKDGVVLTYRIPVKAAGKYVPWFRVGFEWVRADLSYRFDSGAWQSLPATRTTTNVVELGVWSEIAWDRGAPISLKSGTRKLEVKFSTPPKSDRYVFGFDSVALVPAELPWRPDNRLRPGESYQPSPSVKSLPAPNSSAIRTELPLSGSWQVARFDDPDMDVDTYSPVKALPGPTEAPLHYRSIQVPADAWTARPDLSFGHRLVYRTTVQVPNSQKGRSFQLQFGGHAWITSVFVNGKLAGSQQATIVPFSIDLTKHIRVGQANTIEVAVKGAYYAVDNKPGEMDRSRNQPRTEEFLKYLKWIDCTWPTGKGGGEVTQLGLTRPLKLVASGPVRTTDVYVRSSVRRMELAADLELTNVTALPRKVEVGIAAVDDRTGQVAKTFSKQSVSVPAGKAAKLSILEKWPDAKLWWPTDAPGDRPTCYRLRVTLAESGKPLDVSETLFGFRELGVEGRHILVNGIPWRAHSWNSFPLSAGRFGEDEAARFWKWNDRGVRMEGGVHADIFDREGIPGRLSMAWEGMFGQVAMENPRMWDNWRLHAEQMVKAYRNHPSVLHWVIGNEVHMITGRLFFGDKVSKHERQMKAIYDVVKRLDPTRTVSEDGAGDLGGLADSTNWHYITGEYKIPEQFFTYKLGPSSSKREYVDYQDLNRWDGDRPLIQGEEMYFDGMGNFAWFGGPSVYRGAVQRQIAGGKYGRIYTEGARWQDVFMVHPCGGPLPGVSVSMARRGVYIREQNSTFAPSSEVKRSYKVFNDTRTDQALDVRWSLVLGGRVVQSGNRVHNLKAGFNEAGSITLKMPETDQPRVEGQLRLELQANGQTVFEDQKPIHLLPRLAAQPALNTTNFGIWDPAGKVSAWLAAGKQAFARLSSLSGLPSGLNLVLVGPNAITEANRAEVAGALRQFVSSGKTAIVLEQSVPLREADFPAKNIVIADRERGKAARPEWEKVGGYTGAIAHPMAPAHPVLKNIAPDDLFTWAGIDQLNYWLSYATPASGTINLIQAGEDLSLAPMFELLVGRGSYLMSQMLIGEKLTTDPTAGRLLQNALAWAADRGNAKVRRTVVVSDGDTALTKYVQDLGIDLTVGTTVDQALASDVDIAVVKATPGLLQALVQRADQVRAMANRGGWLMLVGLDGPGLEAFNRLVGVQHRIRPFRKESVLVDAFDDPLMMGITDRDLQQVDPEVIAPWMGLQRVSGKVFGSVIDSGIQLASFAQLSAFGEGADRPLTDGLTGETFWRYTQYLNANGNEPIVMRWDREETINQFEVWQSDSYIWAKDVEILVDGKPVAKGQLKKQSGWQTFDFPAMKAKEITIKFPGAYPPTKQVSNNLFTIDEVRVRRAAPLAGTALTNLGGLVKFSVGSGGILLNQVRYDSDDLPENLAKKKILFGSLLRNLGATFK